MNTDLIRNVEQVGVLQSTATDLIRNVEQVGVLQSTANIPDANELSPW